jgi:hypothetical protein
MNSSDAERIGRHFRDADFLYCDVCKTNLATIRCVECDKHHQCDECNLRIHKGHELKTHLRTPIGESQAIDADEMKRPPEPVNLRVKDVTDTTIKMRWDQPRAHPAVTHWEVGFGRSFNSFCFQIAKKRIVRIGDLSPNTSNALLCIYASSFLVPFSRFI